MIKAYNLETKELLGKYKTQQEVADDFDLTWEAVKGYFYRKKIYGDAKILDHRTKTWCYLVKEEEGKSINYKERCQKAIEYIKEKYEYVLRDSTFLDHDELVDRKQILHILEILGDKEIEEIPLFEGTLEQLNNLSIIGDKENE